MDLEPKFFYEKLKKVDDTITNYKETENRIEKTVLRLRFMNIKDVEEIFSLVNDKLPLEFEKVADPDREVIRIIKAGIPMNLLQEKAFSVLGEGLQDLKYIKDKNNLDEVKKYFMHGIGHSLGIDVHDPGVDRKTDMLIEGMVITIEPGLYVRERAIGVRIEDNIVVTRSGYENLTAGLNK
jgi:Xaa-Pro aminopeptidase